MSKLVFRVTALAALLFGTSAASPPVPQYLLSMHFEDGGQLIGNPRLEVAIGEPAEVMVGDARGSFTMRMVATPAGEGKLSVASTIDAVNAEGVHRRASPALVVAINRLATIEFGDSNPVANPVRVSFTYQPR